MTDGFPEADYIFASGSLNYRSENELFPYNIIRKMYASARKGIAFNLPDKDFQQPGNYLGAYDQVTVINFCRTLSPDWQVINGYLPGDFTLFVYKK
jgi:hypothetical protein